MNRSSKLTLYFFIYAFGCFVFPPLHVHGKTFFWAEILLLPVLAASAKNFLAGGVRSVPRALVWVWAACVAAFISGYWRGHTGLDVSIYQNLPPSMVQLKSDVFSVSRDGVSFLRWLIIFSTPWLTRSFCQGVNRLETVGGKFWSAVEWAVVVSALLSVADHFHAISLTDWGFHDTSEFWVGRSFGTGPSPLEGGVVYGALLVSSVVSLSNFGRLKSVERLFQSVVAILCAYALFLTRTATADVAVGLTIITWLLLKLRTHKERFVLCLIVILGCAGIPLFTPPHFLSTKIGDLVYRSTTWIRFASIVPGKPWLLVTGLGFSGIVVDNSVILLVMKGGLFLLISLGAWMKKLYRFVPEKFLPVFLFWVFTWIALDSIGFWGLGRVLWFLLGLLYSSGSLATVSAERTLNSPPRGSNGP